MKKVFKYFKGRNCVERNFGEINLANGVSSFSFHENKFSRMGSIYHTKTEWNILRISMLTVYIRVCGANV